MSLNERLKNTRKKANKTQAELAKMLDISENTIKRYEKDASKIPVSVVSKIALLCNEDEIWLFTGKTNIDLKTNSNNQTQIKFKSQNEGNAAINALLEIENINEQTFLRAVADLKFIAGKLKDGATPGPLITIPENKTLGELTKEKDRI
ncbi:helix-turn-helix transcriptional regulator [uncultured Desulfobacter sp.]|uniref:helix-turn-helix domain-containing protein n=1 Tax=uncultured Desulfobacter sp. TaxID=240139 RepID=UPI0029F49667|nr:helix-turn-helix transcriptional regulator [uncultured Desulfobacter sp.]